MGAGGEVGIQDLVARGFFFSLKFYLSIFLFSSDPKKMLLTSDLFSASPTV